MANQTCNPSILTQALGITATGPRTVIVPADPIIWDAETSYEYLTLVASTDFGQAYISKRDVPAGTELTNTEYWIPAASYNAQLAAIQAQLASLAPQIEQAANDVKYPLAITKESGNDYGTINAMLACADTYFQAVRDGNLTYGDGTMQSQPAGTISCSSFLWAILHGIPYDDYKFANATSTSNSGQLHRYGYTLSCDMNGNPVTLTAQATYDYCVTNNFVRNATSFEDVNVGDILFIGDSTESVTHCALVVGFNFFKTTAFIIESSRDTSGPATISAGPRLNGISSFDSVVGVGYIPVTSVNYNARPIPISINLDSNRITMAGSSRASLACFLRVHYHAQGGSTVSLAFNNGAGSVATYSLQVANTGEGDIYVPNYYATYCDVSGADWFYAYATTGYGESNEVYLVGSEERVVNFIKNTSFVPPVAFISSAASITANLAYSLVRNGRGIYSTSNNVIAIATNSSNELVVGVCDTAAATTFTKVPAIAS